jgi:hypothetical protein
LSISAQNYQVRQDILTRHQERIASLEATLKESSGALFDIVAMLLDVLRTFMVGGGTESDDSWKETFDAIESSIGDMDEWVSGVFAADAAEPQLPVPMPPQLPELPDKAKKQPSKAVIYYAAKLGIKLFTEWLRRHKEHDPDVAEGIERAFFFDDPEEVDQTKKRKSIFERGLLKTVTGDEKNKVKALIEKAFFFDDPEEEDINKKMKSILDRGLLKTITEDDKDKVIALLEILDQDLALVDATVDFGAFRVCIKGKTIQYG